MTQDWALAVPFAWFGGRLVPLKIAQMMLVRRPMAIMLAAAAMVSG